MNAIIGGEDEAGRPGPEAVTGMTGDPGDAI